MHERSLLRAYVWARTVAVALRQGRSRGRRHLGRHRRPDHGGPRRGHVGRRSRPLWGNTNSKTTTRSTASATRRAGAGTARLVDERGGGPISIWIGFLVFLVMLLFAVQVLFNLYATSVVTAVAYDAARRVAGGGGGTGHDGRRRGAGPPGARPLRRPSHLRLERHAARTRSCSGCTPTIPSFLLPGIGRAGRVRRDRPHHPHPGGAVPVSRIAARRVGPAGGHRGPPLRAAGLRRRHPAGGQRLGGDRRQDGGLGRRPGGDPGLRRGAGRRRPARPRPTPRPDPPSRARAATPTRWS